MTKDRTRKLKIRAVMAASGRTYGEAAAALEQWTVPDAGRRPPAGVPMAPDPLRQADSGELFTAPLMMVTMLPRGQVGLDAAQLIADACDYLISREGWYRARAEVYGPRPTRETGMPPLTGHMPAMLLVRVSARRRWTAETLHDFLRDAITAILSALVKEHPRITERHVSVQALPPETGQQIVTVQQGKPDALTTEAHPSLTELQPLDDEPDEIGEYPFRVVDRQDVGWFAVRPARYTNTLLQSSGGEPQSLDDLDAERGPLRTVVPAPEEDLERLRDALAAAGTRATASLLVALYRLARRHADQEYERSERRQSSRLYAGGDDTWETQAMRSLIWVLGVDLADKTRRLDEQAMQEVMTVVDQWVTPEAGVYVEVAGSVARAFQAAAARAGGWEVLADRHFQPGDRFAHSVNAVEGTYAWLMGEPMPSAGR
ncbi:hypothetical protein ACIBBE_24325 [Streptomyces sp. NPDC051644]|uniref:hypothetical protein n=1 Tax=Streptomyces sp. NPDC051644 TaxID=3365666 RepID=UPI00379A5B7B